MQRTENVPARNTLGAKPAHLKTLLQLLNEYTPEAEVWAYGSCVNGDAHECSDLDLVLRNPSDLMIGPICQKVSIKKSLVNTCR
jgi:predicted nucleotidyltransferase